MPTLHSVAARVIGKASREHRADEVLRAELKAAKGLSRQHSGEVSRLVFAYYRWLGWLDQTAPLEQQIRQATELNYAFQKDPKTITLAEFDRAVPPWAKDELSLSTQWLQTLQKEPSVWLRARKGQGPSLAGQLGTAWAFARTDGILYEGDEDMFRSAEFQAGKFELQDISSQAVGLVCDPQPGETWWDACAGEGGKLLHLCDLMQGKGLVWASDRVEWRLQKLKRRAARAQTFNYRTVLWNGGTKPPTKTKFDGILVDAPCSGIGTWQRNPHARWTTTANDVAELAAIQKQLLENVAGSLKPGGKLIYAVCTLSRKETEEVAAHFGQRFSEFKPLALKNPLSPNDPPQELLWLWPQDTDGNGMFICGWQKPKPQKIG